MAQYMPFHPVLDAFGSSLKIEGTGASTANQHAPHSRLGKVQCIRSYGFLKALLHMVGSYIQMQLLIGQLPSYQLLLSSKKWLLQREGRQNRRHSIEMKSDWLSDKQRSCYWLRVAASNPASQSTCLAGVTQSHCNPQ